MSIIKKCLWSAKVGKGVTYHIFFHSGFQAWKFSHFIMNYVVDSSSTFLVTEYDAGISSLGLYESEDFRWLYGHIDSALSCFA